MPKPQQQQQKRERSKPDPVWQELRALKATMSGLQQDVDRILNNLQMRDGWNKRVGECVGKLVLFSTGNGNIQNAKLVFVDRFTVGLQFEDETKPRIYNKALIEFVQPT